MEQILKILIEDYARQIGLILLDGDAERIHNLCLMELNITSDDLQTILFDLLGGLQEFRVNEKSSLVCTQV
jgi:hypothetical protein